MASGGRTPWSRPGQRPQDGSCSDELWEQGERGAGSGGQGPVGTGPPLKAVPAVRRLTRHQRGRLWRARGRLETTREGMGSTGSAGEALGLDRLHTPPVPPPVATAPPTAPSSWTPRERGRGGSVRWSSRVECAHAGCAPSGSCTLISLVFS